jgi:hypothetical protein
MAQAVPNPDLDFRMAARHRANHTVIAESKLRGDTQIHIMIDDNPGFEGGERVELRLPVIGRIEALVIWTSDNRAGFQFERVLRLPHFVELLKIISPKLR